MTGDHSADSEVTPTPPGIRGSSDGWPPTLPLKPWTEYHQDAMAALALFHEIAHDQNQQYSEACRKVKAFLTKFQLWVTP